MRERDYGAYFPAANSKPPVFLTPDGKQTVVARAGKWVDVVTGRATRGPALINDGGDDPAAQKPTGIYLREMTQDAMARRLGGRLRNTSANFTFTPQGELPALRLPVCCRNE
jgi:hypothetical protein